MSVEQLFLWPNAFLSSGFNVAQTTSLLFFIEELVSHAVSTFESSGGNVSKGLPFL